MLPGSPRNVPKKPFVPVMPEPLCAIGLPKPILNAQRHQTMSVTQNATNVSIIALTDQRFCITPPYRTARPGRLISPTNVAAVICHALSPAFSQLGYDSQVMCLRSYGCLRLSAHLRSTDAAHQCQSRYEIRDARTGVGPSWPTLATRVSTFV